MSKVNRLKRRRMYNFNYTSNRTMKVANTVQEYINLYISGCKMSEISASEEIKKSLISSVEENKDRSNHILNIYAVWLIYGYYIDKNIDKAVAIFKKLATQGYARAQFNLGYCYSIGQGVEKDYTKAAYWYEKAAAQGYADAQCNSGNCYKTGQGVVQDYTKAVYWYEKSAIQGNANAQCNLGNCYYFGRGITRDYGKAVYWYEKSATQGNANAQCNLGNCYSGGKGGTQDYTKAAYWYEKAATQGNANAQSNLGYCYSIGQGVEKDYTKAAYWYEKAAAQGYADAQCNLGNCYKTGQGVVQDYTKAVYWYEKSAIQGNTKAQFNLGNCYYFGRGITRDYGKAVYWYEKSATQGNANAQFNLGNCYSGGKGGTQDYTKAAYWYEKSATQGNANAQFNLGYCYSMGQGVKKDYAKAVYWFQQAADKGFARAQYYLAIFYEKGYSCEIDFEQALFWYQKAIDNGLIEAQSNYERIKRIIQTQKEKNVLNYSLDLKLGERKDVFISWNHKDIDIKNNIVTKLSQLNFNSVWESDGSGHGDLNDVIKDAILDSKSAIIILTENSIKSDWVKQEVEWILKKVEKNSVYKATIKPILLSRPTQDLSKIINDFNDDNIFKKLINNFACIFCTTDQEVDIHLLKEFVEQAIDKVLKFNYKENIISSLSNFKISIASSLSNDNSVSGIIKSMISFENGYVDRLVYKNNKPYKYCDLLQNIKPCLIYGNGGVGKSLYLKNMIRKFFVDNSIFFYLEAKNMSDISEQNNLLEIIKKNSFDFYYPTYKSYVVNEKFEDIFINHNKKYILIDALDEMSKEKLTILMHLIHKFKNKYDDVYFIFTSRNASNKDLLEATFEEEVDLFELRSFTNEEIILLFKNLATNLDKNNDVSELSFTNDLKDISEDVKNNPMLISNLIFIYLATNKCPKKRYEIIKNTVDLLINDIEKQRNLNFIYEEYLINNLLSDLLGTLSILRANGDLRETVDIFKEFFKDKIKQEDNLDVVAKEIYEYLTRRAIIVNGRVSHELFSEYFISTYIFKYVYSLKSSITGRRCILMNQELFKEFIDDCFSINDYPWTSITANFICKLDYEINAINGNRSMDESNHNYAAFDHTLKTGITNRRFSSNSIDVISDLLRRDSFYFNEFIKKYYSR